MQMEKERCCVNRGPFLGREGEKRIFNTSKLFLLSSPPCSWKAHLDSLWWGQGYLEISCCSLVTWPHRLCPRLVPLLLGLWSWGRAR